MVGGVIDFLVVCCVVLCCVVLCCVVLFCVNKQGGRVGGEGSIRWGRSGVMSTDRLTKLIGSINQSMNQSTTTTAQISKQGLNLSRS